jgi:hypothetical protein
MIHLYDRAAFQRVHALHIDPAIKLLLADRIAALRTPYGDLTDWTEFIVVQSGDIEDDIVRAIGFSPLIEPIDGARHGEPGFAPGWDHLESTAGCYILTVTFGSAFAYVLVIPDQPGVLPELLDLCRSYAST